MIIKINKINKKAKKLNEAYDISNFAISADADDFFKEMDRMYKSAKNAIGEEPTEIHAKPVNLQQSNIEDVGLMNELGLGGYTSTITGQVHAGASAAEKNELKKYAANSNVEGLVWGDWDAFLETFKETMAENLGLEVEYGTYTAPNKKNEKSEKIIFQGKRSQQIRDIPTVIIYLDTSGSWYGTTADKLAHQLLLKLVELDSSEEAQEWADNPNANRKKTTLDGDLLNLKLKFFSDYVHATPEERTGGTMGWNYILEDIKGEEADNVIIITDNDCGRCIRYGEDNPGSNYDTRYAKPALVLDGSVWYIWGGDACKDDQENETGKYGNQYTKAMIRHLHSADAGHTYQYFLTEANIRIY